MVTIMQYEFKSLEEMARFFDSQAKGCKAAATREDFTAKARLWNREAYAWSQAADVVRNSAIVSESKFTDDEMRSLIDKKL